MEDDFITGNELFGDHSKAMYNETGVGLRYVQKKKLISEQKCFFITTKDPHFQCIVSTHARNLISTRTRHPQGAY